MVKKEPKKEQSGTQRNGFAGCADKRSAWHKFRTATIAELRKDQPGLSYAGREQEVRGAPISFESLAGP